MTDFATKKAAIDDARIKCDAAIEDAHKKYKAITDDAHKKYEAVEEDARKKYDADKAEARKNYKILINGADEIIAVGRDTKFNIKGLMDEVKAVLCCLGKIIIRDADGKIKFTVDDGELKLSKLYEGYYENEHWENVSCKMLYDAITIDGQNIADKIHYRFKR